MQILLIAATETEILPFSAANTGIDRLITGIGVPATIYRLQKRIQQHRYDLIIQAGIAGSFNNKVRLGQAVFIQQDCFADLGFEEQDHFTPISHTAFSDKNEFPFSNGWLKNPDAAAFNIGLQTVKAVTVNTVSDRELQKQQFINAFDADIESMEGAALHYVCLQENIPFAQIRSVSNQVGQRDKTKWVIPEAIENLNTALAAMIKKITD